MGDTPPEIPATLTWRKLAVEAVVLAGVALAAGLACTFLGEVGLSWDVWTMRAFRLMAAAVVGAGLGAAGMALQALLRNPLAEPYVLGISSGAGVGVLVGTALAPVVALPAWAGTPVLALVGAAATCGAVYGVAQRRGRLDPYALLLSGVIVNAFNGALMLGIVLFLDPNRLLGFIRWGMGEVSDSIWFDRMLLVVCAGAVVAGWGVLLLRGAAFNVLGLGDAVAASSGVGVHRLRVETFALASLMTAGAVALAGPVGFLGLIVPHVCRMIVGPDHRRLVVHSGFVGAIALMLADTLCRTVGQWLGAGRIPVGVLTALAGGPFFIHLLRRRFREGAP